MAVRNGPSPELCKEVEPGQIQGAAAQAQVPRSPARAPGLREPSPALLGPGSGPRCPGSPGTGRTVPGIRGLDSPAEVLVGPGSRF